MPNLRYINPLLTCPDTVAIVGSSGRLLGKKYGELIDSFEKVIRFNRAPTEGFEEFVGSKTTTYWLNRHVLFSTELTPKDIQEREAGFWTGQDLEFITKINNKNIIAYLTPLELSVIYETSKINKNNKVFSYNEDLFVKDFKICNSTSGLSLIYSCVTARIVPHLFGFDIEDERERDHYWEKRPLVASSIHNMLEEKTRIKNLIAQKKVVFYE